MSLLTVAGSFVASCLQGPLGFTFRTSALTSQGDLFRCKSQIRLLFWGFEGFEHTEKPKPRIWGNSTQKSRVKEIFLEVILTPIPK